MKAFKYLDFVSLKPEMLFSKKERIKTSYGGFLSVLIVTLGLVAASYFIYEFVSNARPVINGRKFFSKNFLRSFNVSNYFIMMTINDGNGNKLENPETIFTPHIYHFNYFYTQQQDPARDSSTLETYKIKSQKCSQDYIDKNYPDKSKEIPAYSGYFCLEPDFNFTVLNPFGNVGNNSYLNIYFAFCNNKTEQELGTGVVCKPLDYIQSVLGSYSARIAFFDSYLSHDDYKQPLKPFLNSAIAQGSANRYNRLKVFFQSTEYETDIGWLIYEPKWDYGFNKVNQEITIDDRVESKKYVPQTFFQLTIANDISGFHERYLRSYRKIQNIMADIGGFTNVLLIIGNIIALIFSQVEYWQLILRDCSAIINIEELNFDKNIAILRAETMNIDGNALQIKNDEKIEDNSDERVLEEETNGESANNCKAENKDNPTEEKEKGKSGDLENGNGITQHDPQIKKPIIGNWGGVNGKFSSKRKSKQYNTPEKLEDLKNVTSKIKFLKPRFTNQFKVQLCCFQRSDNDNLVDSINNYHMHVLDVRTIIQLHNEMKTLKHILMNKNQRKLFEFISNLKNTKEVERYGGDHYDKILKKKEEANQLEELRKHIGGIEECLEDEITNKLMQIFSKKVREQNDEVIRRRKTILYAAITDSKGIQ